jgi:hypothetical protein
MFGGLAGNDCSVFFHCGSEPAREGFASGAENFGLGTYPLLRVLRLAVSPDGDLLFYKRQKK